MLTDKCDSRCCYGTLPGKTDGEKFRSLIRYIKEILVLEVKFAQEALLEEIQSVRERPASSDIMAEKATEYYELLKISIGIDADDFIPPRIDYLRACMVELLAQKKKFNANELEAKYKNKFSDEPVGKFCFPAFIK